jgi:hypothetical protein
MYGATHSELLEIHSTGTVTSLAVHQTMNNGKGVFGTTRNCYAAVIGFNTPALDGRVNGTLRGVSHGFDRWLDRLPLRSG